MVSPIAIGIRNLLDKLATEGGLSPVMRRKASWAPLSGRRPGDVTIPLWAGGKGLAVDVAVTSPFTATLLVQGHQRCSAMKGASSRGAKPATMWFVSAVSADSASPMALLGQA